MNRRSLEKLRMDRRLAGRSGWMTRAELERETEGLPDASGKVADDEEPTQDESEAAAPEADPPMASPLNP